MTVPDADGCVTDARVGCRPYSAPQRLAWSSFVRLRRGWWWEFCIAPIVRTHLANLEMVLPTRKAPT